MLLAFIEGLMLVHIAAGLVCLCVAPIAMLAKPKGGAFHRTYGRLFLWGIATLAATAALLLVFRWNPFFFALSVLSFYLSFSGWRVLQRKRPERGERARWLDWVAALAAVITGLLSLYWSQAGVFGRDASVVLATLGVAVLIALCDLWLFIRVLRAGNSPLPGMWRLEHLTKLSGAYLAVACAFSGTVFTFLPMVIAQTWPAIVGTPLLIVVARRHWLKLTTSA